MATIRAKTVDVHMTLRFVRISDRGQPKWVDTFLDVRQEEVVVQSSTLSITEGDAKALVDGLRAVGAAQRDAFAVTTSDDNLVLVVEAASLPGDVHLGFWTGEPYGLMKGLRFIVVNAELISLASQVESELYELLASA